MTPTAADSLFSGNNTGIEAAGTNHIFMVVGSKIVNNNIGLLPDGNGAILYLALSTVSGSTFRGYDIENGAVLKSYGNNFMTDANNLGTLRKH